MCSSKAPSLQIIITSPVYMYHESQISSGISQAVFTRQHFVGKRCSGASFTSLNVWHLHVFAYTEYGRHDRVFLILFARSRVTITCPAVNAHWAQCALKRIQCRQAVNNLTDQWSCHHVRPQLLARSPDLFPPTSRPHPHGTVPLTANFTNTRAWFASVRRVPCVRLTSGSHVTREWLGSHLTREWLTASSWVSSRPTREYEDSPSLVSHRMYSTSKYYRKCNLIKHSVTLVATYIHVHVYMCFVSK